MKQRDIIFSKNIRQICSVVMAILFFLFVFGGIDAGAETYEYDKLNRVVKVVYADNSYTTYEYDANGNIKKQTYYGNK